MNPFSRPALRTGTSYVIWNKATGKALDGGTAQASVVQWTYTGLPQQRWTLEEGYAGGVYRLRCERSGQFLTCRSGSGATQETTDHHFWRIEPAQDGAFLLHQDYAGSFLHTPDANKDSGRQPRLGGEQLLRPEPLVLRRACPGAVDAPPRREHHHRIPKESPRDRTDDRP
ncbi:RICIN domain-containing protein [Streptomyces sp. NPDC048664]|uniref:RICIN domain-containing protein n=1 Tax=Streptomyces sp. NPDC048664 TaxID=3154505 RepID=UPI00342CCE2F